MTIEILSKEFLKNNITQFVNILDGIPHEYWESEHFLKELPRKWNFSTVVTESNEIIGYIIASKKELSVHIHKFIIKKEFRNKKIGNNLFLFFENICKKNNITKITLKVYRDNVKAVNFYVNLGFIKDEENEELLIYQKNILKIISIHQPNFFPWIGYFYKILKSNKFVILDEVQYTKNSFINRNRIKTPSGIQWFSLPVIHSGHFGQKINETKIMSPDIFKRKIIKSLISNYSKSKYSSLYLPELENIFFTQVDNIAELNTILLEWVISKLGIQTEVIISSSLNIIEDNPTTRLIKIIKAVGGNIYFSGFGGDNYQDIGQFNENNIVVIHSDFKHPIYTQLWGNFVPNLSIIDLLFNEGPFSKDFLK
ncbi:MAG: WbqC family protein [Lentimicrobiaceae bacterium]|nr:WbqC family protein [Lentimicrobiaceae bacterium]